MPLNERNTSLLTARGFNAELLELYGIADSERRGFDVQIPYFDGDRLINRKYRNIEKRADGNNFSQDAGAKLMLWNSGVISDPAMADKPLLFFEGEFDALSAIQAGFPRAVSVPNGAPAEAGESGERYLYLDNAPAELRDANEIILCTDGDGPGTNLRDDLSLRLGRSRCKHVKYPKGCKDLNDALRLFGVRGVEKTIELAAWMDVPGVYTIDELPLEPVVMPHEVGIPGLEKHYRARLGDLCVVTGIPSMGKSAMALAVCCGLAFTYKWPVAIASFEMRLRNDLIPILKTWFGGIPYWRQSEEELEKGEAWVRKQFVFIKPGEEEEPTIAWMLDAMRTAVIRHGVKLIVIDPWNELEHVREKGESLTEYVGWAIKRMKRFAVKHRIHLVIVAHPAKMQRNKDGTIPVPGLYDISDSSHWYNKPDVGIVVHREQSGETVIRVAKSRYHDQIGEPGEAKVRYVRERAAYEAAS